MQILLTDLMRRSGSNLWLYVADWHDSVLLETYKDKYDKPRVG